MQYEVLSGPGSGIDVYPHVAAIRGVEMLVAATLHTDRGVIPVSHLRDISITYHDRIQKQLFYI